MANDRWDNADTEGKLEILRQDITDIASAPNALAREFRDLAQRLTALAQGVEVVLKSLPTTSAEQSSIQRGSHADAPSRDSAAGEGDVTHADRPLD